MKCNLCGSSNIDFYEAAGQSICCDCGAVLEESTIVNSIEFQESGDRAQVIGQYVSATCSKPYSGRMGGRTNDGRDSRDATLTNARRAISQVANSLRLRSIFVDRAFRLYQLALQRGFIFGRKQNHVIATCLYIICRQEKSPHLLLDFSDALQINVYVLGRSFLHFIRMLNIQLPIIDPSLYIHRFAHLLDLTHVSIQEFDEEQKKNVEEGRPKVVTPPIVPSEYVENSKSLLDSIINLSLRIIHRMNKDWMVLGRRPDGICAAALLISCRSHNIIITQEYICSIFRICKETIRNRLLEFKVLPCAQFSIKDFFKNDQFDFEFDPPAFIKSMLKENNEQIKLVLWNDDEVTEKEIEDSNVYSEVEEINVNDLINDIEFALNEDEEEIQKVKVEPKKRPNPTEEDEEEEKDVIKDIKEENKIQDERLPIARKVELNGTSFLLPYPSLKKKRFGNINEQNKLIERYQFYDELYRNIIENSEETSKNENIKKLLEERRKLDEDVESIGGWGEKESKLKQKYLTIKWISGQKKKEDEAEEIDEENADEKNPFRELSEEKKAELFLEGELQSYILSKEESFKIRTIWEKNYGGFIKERERKRKEREEAKNSLNNEKYTASGRISKKYLKNLSQSTAQSGGVTGPVNTSSRNINYDAISMFSQSSFTNTQNDYDDHFLYDSQTFTQPATQASTSSYSIKFSSTPSVTSSSSSTSNKVPISNPSLIRNPSIPIKPPGSAPIASPVSASSIAPKKNEAEEDKEDILYDDDEEDDDDLVNYNDGVDSGYDDEY